jgi:hypothetical protein
MEQNEVEYVEPATDYLGFECEACRRLFPIVGPLDPVRIPPGEPVKIGARHPLHAECPHCQTSADYLITQLRRFRMP